MNKIAEIRTSDDDQELAHEVLGMPITEVHIELRRDRVRFNELLARMEDWTDPNLSVGDPTAEIGQKIIALEESHRSAVATIKIMSVVAAFACALMIGTLFIALSDRLYAAVGATASGALIAIATSSFILAVAGLTATAFRMGRTDLSPAFSAMQIGSSLAYDVSRISEDLDEAERIVAENAENPTVSQQLPLELESIKLSLSRLCSNVNGLCSNALGKKAA